MNVRAFLAPQSASRYSPMTGLTFLLSTAIALASGASAPDWPALLATSTANSALVHNAAQDEPARDSVTEPLAEPETVDIEPVPAPEAAPASGEAAEQVLERAPQRPREVELARLDAYFNALDTLRARFEQISADGRVTHGELALDRPGRVRFDYDDPSPILLVADGSTVAIADFDLETVDRAPIGQTPFKWLLEPDLDPQDSEAVQEISRVDGRLYLTLVDPERETEGRVTLMFDDPDPDAPASQIDLAGWIAVDAFGGFTEVKLSDHARDVRLDPRLFVLDDDPFEDTRRGRR